MRWIASWRRLRRTSPIRPEARSIDTLRARLEAIAEAERRDPKLDPANGTRWWLHDGPTEHVVLALHGYTNNPRQYDVLGPQLFADGHNVIAPRFPYHGYRDRMTEEIAQMRFADWARSAIDSAVLARAGGTRLVTLGISVAATIAAWLAAYLPVDHAIAVAPFVGVRFFNGPLNDVLRTGLERLPDQFIWWDPIREQAQLPLHAYPRFSLRTLRDALRFGETLDTFRAPQQHGRVTLVENAHEPIVNNALAREYFARLANRGVHLETLVREDFPKRHDVFEPSLPGAPDPNVYALLRELVRS
jgi:hypothetical protein